MSDLSSKELLHPVQSRPRNMSPATAPVCVTMRAYEVYCHVHGPQEAMITGHCRGGFGAGEIIAFLYAHTFPKAEWRDRVEEALRGLNV